MSKVTRNRGQSKREIVVKVGAAAYVGLDVHKKTVHAALVVNGVIVKTWSMPADKAAVAASLAPYKAAIKGIVYEAGCTGFALARYLIEQGYPVKVGAPSKMRRAAGPRAKSDRIDCCTLAVDLSKGEVPAVAIPTPIEEADRQVMRLRSQCVSKLKRAKQQIKSFLLAHGIDEPEGLAHWSKASVEALQGLRLNGQLRFSLDCLLEELAYLKGELSRIEEHLRKLAGTRRLRKSVKALDAHTAVGPITAMAFALEIFNPRRFAEGGQVTNYVGLAPRVSQSGSTRRDGPLMKTGRPELRALLIEASWRWVAKDRHAAQVFARLVRNTGSKQKAITGVARRLAIELWKIYRAAV